MTHYIDLFLNIVFGSIFVLSIKWAQRLKNADALTAGPLNYIFGAVLMIPFVSLEPSSSEQSWAIGLGATMGFCYFIAFFFVDVAIRWVGAAATTAVTVLSITMPILCGVFIWNVTPNTIQVAGVVLAMASLVLIGGGSKNQKKQDDNLKVKTEESYSSNNTKWQIDPSSKVWAIPLILVIFFVLAGFARLAQEAFKHHSNPEFQNSYLFSAFSLAAIPSVLFLIVRRKRLGLLNLGIGFVMGAANLLQTFFILRALGGLDGFIVFPVSSAGGLILITLVAVCFMGEAINRKTIIGIAIAVVALAFLNWKSSDGNRQSTQNDPPVRIVSRLVDDCLLLKSF